VSTTTIQDWIERMAEAFASKPAQQGRAIVIELDEIWHFVQKKNKLWIWKAYDRATGRLVDWECGGRDRDTADRLIQRLRAWNARLYCADAYNVYADLIPVGRLYQGKDQTHGVERTNAQQRHWLARFRRRTCVVSKAVRMVEASMALFARFCVNGTPEDLLSIPA
jgi:insertion element IS1 protein InsB